MVVLDEKFALNPIRGTSSLTMSSLLIIMLLMSLATSFCEGRNAYFLHSRKDMEKLTSNKHPSSSSMKEAMAIGVKSINQKSHRKEDNIRRENSSSHVQNSDIVAVSPHEPPYSLSEKKPGFHLDYAGPRIHPPSHN